MKSFIYNLTPFTLQDFPGNPACIIWFYGCNYRCLYCHNPELIEGKKIVYEKEKVISFLKQRKGLLKGVVLSGGESTLYPDLLSLIEEIRAMGFKIKLDTNGGNPDKIKELLVEQVLDYVALDYKAPKDKFVSVTQTYAFERFEKSLSLLIASRIPLEIRTTVHTKLLDEKDINCIIKHLNSIGFDGKYFIQNFQPGKTLVLLPEQERLLEVSVLLKSKNFTIETRNF